MEEPVTEERESPENAPALSTNIENVNRVMKALYIHKKEASYKELFGPSGLHPAVASQALSASKDLGLSRSAGKKGWYLLSSRGVEYARYLTENRTDECRSLLKTIIVGNPLWTDVVAFLRTSEGAVRNPIDLVMGTVEKKLGKQWSPAMRRTVSDSIVSVLEYSGLVKKESGKIISLIGPADALPSEPQPAATYRPFSTVTAIPKSSPEVIPGFYEIAGDGFYFKIRKDPSTIAEAYDHLHLIMKRNSQTRNSIHQEPMEEVREGG